MSWSDKEGEILRWEKETGRGVEEFLRIRHASRPQNQEWMKKWHNATFAGGQGDTSKRPRNRQPPCFTLSSLLPSTFEPFTSNRKKKQGRRKGGEKGQTREREEEKKQVDLKRALMRGQKLGGELPPSFFFIVSGSKLCKRPQGHRMSRGSACDGSRESVTSHGDSLVSPLFRRCPPTNSLHPCSLLKEKKRGYLRNFLSEKEKMEKEIFKCFLFTKKGVARRWRIRFSKKGSEWERGVGRSKNRRNIKRLVKARKVWYSETKRGKAAFTRGNRAKVFSGRPCPVRALSRINRGKRAVTTTDVSPFFSSAR